MDLLQEANVEEAEEAEVVGGGTGIEMSERGVRGGDEETRKLQTMRPGVYIALLRRH